MSNNYTVYQIKNLVNGRKYIGCTGNFFLRMYYHRYNLENNSHSNVLLQTDWNKGHNFEVVELAVVDTEEEARQLEKELIIKFQNTEEGVYNIYHNVSNPDVVHRRNWFAEKKRKFSRAQAYDMARMKFEENRTYEEIAKLYECHPVTVFWNVNCYLRGVTQRAFTRKH